MLKILTEVCKKENVKIEKEAIQLLALSGDGSYRDSLSNLQKVLSFTDEDFTENFVSRILGIPPTKAIFEYLKSVDGAQEAKEGLEVLRKLDEQGVKQLKNLLELTAFSHLTSLAKKTP